METMPAVLSLLAETWVLSNVWNIILADVRTNAIATFATKQKGSLGIDFTGGTVNGQVLQVVPEPSSFALAGFAIAGLAAAGYRRRKAAAKKAA